MDDLRIALRQLSKQPAFTVVAVLTLGLGIGANTAIFSLIHGLLLAPLPYPEPDRLVALWESRPQRGIEQERVSGPNFLDWRARSTTFADMGVRPGWKGSDELNLVLRDTTVRVRGGYASASWFTTLGAKPLLGRSLRPEEDEKGGNRAAVLGHGLWQRLFAGDRNVVGQTLIVDSYGRREYTIVGVMPPGFGLLRGWELWLPLGWMDVSLDERRSAHWHEVIARLGQGVTLAQARIEMDAIQAQLERAHVGESIGSQVAVVPLLRQAIGRDLHTSLLVIWGVVVGVLLIACSNVANLMLARAASRRNEMALRIALGAGRWRLVRQLMSESFVLAMIGGSFGLLLGWWGLQLLLAVSPSEIPRLDEVTLDRTALLFTLLVSLLTGLLAGLAPAVQLWRHDFGRRLEESVAGTSSAGAAAGRTRGALIIAEVAMTAVLLIVAALLLQTFAQMVRADRGFEPQHLLTAELDFSVSGYTTWLQPTRTRPQVPLLEIVQRLRALPGVVAVGAGSSLVREDKRPPQQTFAILGRPTDVEDGEPKTAAKGITPDWLRAVGAPLLRGRDFTDADTLEAPGVVLVNQTFAERFLADEDPIGRRFKLGSSQPPLSARNSWGQSQWSTIVGVVGNVKSLQPRPDAVPEVYFPYWQWPMQSPTIVVRTTGDPAALAQAIRRQTEGVIPDLPAPRIRTMDDLLSTAVALPRLQAGVLSLFAGIALALATVGLYSVLAYTVAQRTREIGVRSVLGARPCDVALLVIDRGMKLALSGIAVGIVVALGATRALRSLLYEVEPTDPLTLVAVSVLLVAIALVACWLPARRAAAVEPMVALRSK